MARSAFPSGDASMAGRAPTERDTMKTDVQLKKDVIAELEWDPAINASQVGVGVKDGVVTLTGHLDTYAEKYAIERAVQRVHGVKAMAVEVDVKLDPRHKRSDSEIAEAAEMAFKWHTLVPADRIQVKVEKGWVTLKGEVDWEYQRQSAEKAVRPLTGVVGVSNAISLKPGTTPANVSTRIRDALARHAEHQAKHIEVTVNGAVVTLHGTVDSWTERAAASSAAWSAPGVASVVNELKVQP
jgi:osmotically-inducible protein OsmY